MIILDSDIFTLFSHGKEVVHRHWETALMANPDEKLVTIVSASGAASGMEEPVLAKVMEAERGSKGISSG